MLKKQFNIVHIDFELAKGLILKWNLTGNLNNCYLHHVLILDIKKLQDYQKEVFQYYQKIKHGDIISIAFVSQENNFFILKWCQKSNISKLQIHKVKPTLSKLQNLYDLIQLIGKRIQEFKQPTFITIFTQKKERILNQLVRYSKEFLLNKQKVFMNILADCTTQIQFTNKIYLFDIKQAKQQQFWNFFKLFLKQVSLLKAKIIIECQNGQLCSQNQSLWKNVEFNRIQRQLKGPTIHYELDQLFFVNQQTTQKVNYVLNITLEYKDIDQKQYKASKTIQINAMSQKIYQRTFGGRQVQYGVEIANGIYCKSNPYKSQSLIWFKKNSLQQTH